MMRYVIFIAAFILVDAKKRVLDCFVFGCASAYIM